MDGDAVNRHLDADGTVRSVTELVAVVLEYEHALLHVIEDHDTACADCARLARGALDGHNAEDFLDIAGDELSRAAAVVDDPAFVPSMTAAAGEPDAPLDFDDLDRAGGDAGECEALPGPRLVPFEGEVEAWPPVDDRSREAGS